MQHFKVFNKCQCQVSAVAGFAWQGWGGDATDLLQDQAEHSIPCGKQSAGGHQALLEIC